MGQSLVILYSIPVFGVLMLCEFLYGMLQQKNTYRFNDTFCSLTLGVLSRFPSVLNLGINSLVYSTILQYLKPNLLPLDSWMTWLFAFLLYDFCYYWQHRLSHERTLLWASHVVHHQSEDYNLGTALRQTSTSFLFAWIFYIPMFLVGVPFDVFVTVAAANLVYQFWVHTEHVGKLGFLEKFLVTPSNHRVHHACNKRYIDANYGGVFILWDKIFRTFVDETVLEKPMYGTLKPLRSWNPLWANMQVYHQMVCDAWHTERLKDKLRVWGSRTGWRPKDVKERFPTHSLRTPDPVKYETRTSLNHQIFAVSQFVAYSFLTFVIVISRDNLTEFEIASFAIIVTASAFISAGHLDLDSRKTSTWLEVVRSLVVLGFVFLTSFWSSELIAVQILWTHALLNLVLIPMFLNFNLGVIKMSPR